MDSYTIAHRFFHENNKRGKYIGFNNWFNGSTYFSYATCIGELVKDLNGNNVLLVPDTNYSHSTSKHINQLIQACPYRVLFVPSNYGDSSILYRIQNKFDVAVRFAANTQYNPMTRAENRKRLHNIVQQMNTYNDVVGGLNLSVLKKVEVAYKECIRLQLKAKEQQIRLSKRTTEEKEAARLKREAAAKRKLERIMNGDYLTMVSSAFSKNGNKEIKKMLNIVANNVKRYSYVWFDGDYAVTSQHVKVDREQVERLLKLWKNGCNLIGEKAGIYSIVANNNEYIKIGCHIIPVKNVEELYKQIQL